MTDGGIGLMDRQGFREKLEELVNEAVAQDVSPHQVEHVLQSESQSIRKDRRRYSVFVFGCSHYGCEKSTSRYVDQIKLTCDVCKAPLTASFSIDSDGVTRIVFQCDDHETTRIHEFAESELICPIHNETMELTESYSTEEGVGKQH